MNWTRESNLIGVVRLQERQQHSQVVMTPQPVTDLLDTFVISVPKFLEINLIHMISGFGCVQLTLPGLCEKVVQVIVQVPVDEHVPFMLLHPDPIALTTAVQLKVCIRKDLKTRHDVAAI